MSYRLDMMFISAHPNGVAQCQKPRSPVPGQTASTRRPPVRHGTKPPALRRSARVTLRRPGRRMRCRASLEACRRMTGTATRRWPPTSPIWTRAGGAGPADRQSGGGCDVGGPAAGRPRRLAGADRGGGVHPAPRGAVRGRQGAGCRAAAGTGSSRTPGWAWSWSPPPAPPSTRWIWPPTWKRGCRGPGPRRPVRAAGAVPGADQSHRPGRHPARLVHRARRGRRLGPDRPRRHPPPGRSRLP
jgi:hypothetical protein